MIEKLKKHRFLFEELVKRDFNKKYKRTVLGIFWSLLEPLMMLLVMAVVFTQFFGRTTPHYIIYLFCGNLVFGYFSSATNGGMASLAGNAGIFSKVNVPKYLFLLSNNVSSLLNFLITLGILFVFVAFDKLPFTWEFLLLLYPIGCLIVFNVGLGLILSALFIMFKDISYLYGIFTRLLLYLSAIFYNVNSLSETMQSALMFNPVYVYILYFRSIIIDGVVPSVTVHLLGALYALIAVAIGALIYKKLNYKFLYYI